MSALAFRPLKFITKFNRVNLLNAVVGVLIAKHGGCCNNRMLNDTVNKAGHNINVGGSRHMLCLTPAKENFHKMKSNNGRKVVVKYLFQPLLTLKIKINNNG